MSVTRYITGLRKSYTSIVNLEIDQSKIQLILAGFI